MAVSLQRGQQTRVHGERRAKLVGIDTVNRCQRLQLKRATVELVESDGVGVVGIERHANVGNTLRIGLALTHSHRAATGITST